MAQDGALNRAPPGADAPGPALARLAEVVQGTYDYMPAALAGYVAGVGVVTLLFWGIAPLTLLVPWWLAFALMCAVRLLITHRFQRAGKRTVADWQRWRLRSNGGTLVAAALWGLTGWLFYAQGNGLERSGLAQTGLIIIVYTFCVVAIPVQATQPGLYRAFAALVMLPLVVRIASVGDRYHYELAGELVLIISLTAVLANSYRQALQRAIDLKLQADTLAAQLREQTLVADSARREAETANRAKTQFFTAASHDLRQPLHAMGLFAEALRQRVQQGPNPGANPGVDQPEVASLVNSINESVDALEGLFSELLDITRIDSGGIEVHAEPFEVGDILRKLRLHFEPSAFEKGLALRLRGGARVVHADPLLVERILRNLVSNAIRYTNDGSVLVSSRQRGDRVLLQVWDSGVGIGQAEQARIFDEFYQVPNTERISPDQRKGLGLGLAIVRRLADLMKAPLAVCSQPGRGTVFTLELPRGKAPRAPAAAVPGKARSGITLAGRLIVIVEDEPAVRAGLEVLLQGWGAQVASFDSVAASRAWAQRSDPAQVRPDLLIVDYRLEDGCTGVDAINALRSRFGAATPAILVTGSTMTGHDRDAQQHDFHLLIKPVVPNKLRAMIAFKLGVKAG
ncbi:MAG: response regulator [Burkholderiales bacterium]|nr:response regulator [Burkholderiales bacterium]